MNLKQIATLTLRSLPIRFIGELMLLGLILLFVEFRIGERKTIDWRQHYRVSRTEKSIDQNLIIIKIDDYAYRSIPDGEVSRKYLAALVNELKSYSPKVIGLDFLLTTHFSDNSDGILSEFKKLNPDYKP